MADSHQISLGIGTPASIKRFVLFGLAPAATGVNQAGVLFVPVQKRRQLVGVMDRRQFVIAQDKRKIA